MRKVLLIWLALLLLSVPTGAEPSKLWLRIQDRKGQTIHQGFAPLEIYLQAHVPSQGALCISSTLHGSSCEMTSGPFRTIKMVLEESDSFWAEWTDGQRKEQTGPQVIEVR